MVGHVSPFAPITPYIMTDSLVVPMAPANFEMVMTTVALMRFFSPPTYLGSDDTVLVFPLLFREAQICFEGHPAPKIQ